MPITLSTIKESIKNDVLDLSSKHLTNDDINLVCTFLNEHPNVKIVHLRFNQISDEGAKTLAMINTNIYLDLFGNQISDDGAKALAKNKYITSLNLTYNNIGDDGAKALAANTTLNKLFLSSNNIGNAGAKALAANTTITILCLSNNLISNEGAKALATNTTLKSLELNQNSIGNEGHNALAANTTLNPDETGLSMLYNLGFEDYIDKDKLDLSNLNASHFNYFLKKLNIFLNLHPEIKTLKLTDIYVEPKEFPERFNDFIELTKNQNITSLALSRSTIGNDVVKVLAANTTITKLHLSQCKIGDEGAQILATNKTITSLDLSNNYIGNEGAIALAANTTIESLNLSHNRIKNEGASALEANTTIKSLDLDSDEISTDTISIIFRDISDDSESLDENPEVNAPNADHNDLSADFNNVEKDQGLTAIPAVTTLGLNENEITQPLKETELTKNKSVNAQSPIVAPNNPPQNPSSVSPTVPDEHYKDQRFLNRLVILASKLIATHFFPCNKSAEDKITEEYQAYKQKHSDMNALFKNIDQKIQNIKYSGIKSIINFKNELVAEYNNLFNKSLSFTAEIKTNRKPLTTPALFDKLAQDYDSTKGCMGQARAILNDYTQDNSVVQRFTAGYWNRHHVSEVHRIVQAIDEGVINNKTDLMFALNVIELTNPKGSLAQSIQFIGGLADGPEHTARPSL